MSTCPSRRPTEREESDLELARGILGGCGKFAGGANQVQSQDIQLAIKRSGLSALERAKIILGALRGDNL